MAAPAANVFHWSLPAAVFVPRPFLRLMAASASRIAPDTHQDQASARVRPAPWRHGRPRRTLVPSRIQKSSTELWLPAGRRQSPDGLRCGRSAVTAAGDGDPASNSVQLVAAPVTVRGSPDRRRPFRQSSALHRTACPPLGYGSRRAPACAPTPWWQRCCWSWPSCAHGNAWPRGKSAWQNSPPRRRLRQDICCRS